MDGRRFDSLVRALAEAGTRRGLLRLVMTLPVVGGLFALLAPEDADTKGRRKRRKKRHKHGQGNGRHRKGKKKQKCQAKSKARTCANRCGTVKDNCGKKIDCGSCVCDPACPVCQICNERSGVCEPDPALQGDACDDGQNCTIGTCDGGVCVSSPCSGQTPVCDGTNCGSCGAFCGTDYCITLIGGASFCADTVVEPGEFCPACNSSFDCRIGEVCAESAYYPSNNPICPNTPEPEQGLCIGIG